MLDLQKGFNEEYISSSEIMAELDVTRTAIFTARHAGRLPGAIDVQGKIYLWKRASIRPYLDAWKTVLRVRRGIA